MLNAKENDLGKGLRYEATIRRHHAFIKRRREGLEGHATDISILGG